MSHNIQARKIPFHFDTGIDPVWNPSQHEWSHMLNGASLTMPYLEPFLIKTLREALPRVEDEDLREDVSGFVQQEAQHFQNHRKYNEMLKRRGYAELSEVEALYEASYESLSKRSLDFRLAYSAGFETMTMGITEWLVADRDALFGDADPIVSSFVLWHMIEETEHKSVAFDVFQAASGNYALRVLGLICGSMHVGWLSRKAYIAMLKKDGVWHSLQSRLRLWKMVIRFFYKAGGAMLEALKPNYHPDKVTDPEWVAQWQRRFEDDTTQIPLLLTRSGAVRLPTA
ncbi:MAG: metal-dependent hydrolase [Congregibacter sp.]